MFMMFHKSLCLLPGELSLQLHCCPFPKSSVNQLTMRNGAHIMRKDWYARVPLLLQARTQRGNMPKRPGRGTCQPLKVEA